LETDGDQLYQVHNGPRAYPGQRPQSIGSVLQSQLLGSKESYLYAPESAGESVQGASTPH